MSRTVCFTERIISCWGYPLTQHTIWWKNNSMQIFFWTKVYPNKVLGNKTEHSVEIVTLDSRYIIEWQLVRLDIYPTWCVVKYSRLRIPLCILWHSRSAKGFWPTQVTARSVSRAGSSCSTISYILGRYGMTNILSNDCHLVFWR